MGMWSRRSALGAIAGMALTSLAGLARAADGLRLPQVPMRLARRLIRELQDGDKILVEREWLVNFSMRPGGIAVDGRQLHAYVQAPPRIAAIAEIERNRSTEGLFPILLDSTGMIASVGPSETYGDVDAAVRAAEQIFARAAVSESESKTHRRLLAQLQQAGSSMLDQMPRDLFFPRRLALHETRPLALPDGTIGEFELVYTAQTTPGAAWLDRAERRVTTRLAGSERFSSETWSLAET